MTPAEKFYSEFAAAIKIDVGGIYDSAKEYFKINLSPDEVFTVEQLEEWHRIHEQLRDRRGFTLAYARELDPEDVFSVEDLRLWAEENGFVRASHTEAPRYSNAFDEEPEATEESEAADRKRQAEERAAREKAESEIRRAREEAEKARRELEDKKAEEERIKREESDRVEAERKRLEAAGDREKLLMYLHALNKIEAPVMNGDKARRLLLVVRTSVKKGIEFAEKLDGEEMF